MKVAFRTTVGAKRLEDLVVFRTAVQFKLKVYEIVRQHTAAETDLRYRSQLFEAVSGVEANIAEGWRRFVPTEFRQFLRYGLGSAEETKRRLVDGAHRGYFTAADIKQALDLADRCIGEMTNLWKALRHSPYQADNRPKRPRRRRR